MSNVTTKYSIRSGYGSTCWQEEIDHIQLILMCLFALIKRRKLNRWFVYILSATHFALFNIDKNIIFVRSSQLFL